MLRIRSKKDKRPAPKAEERPDFPSLGVYAITTGGLLGSMTCVHDGATGVRIRTCTGA